MHYAIDSCIVQCKHSIIGKAFNWSQRHNWETMWNWAGSIYEFLFIISSQCFPSEIKFTHCTGIEFHSVGQYLDQMRPPRKNGLGFCSLNPLICSLNLLIFSLNPLHLFYGSIHVIFEPTHLFFSSAHLLFESAHVTIRYGHLIFESAHVTFGPAICFLINSCNRWIRSCGL